MFIRAKYLHAVESATNVVVGYFINVFAVYLILHGMGLEITMTQNAGMGIILGFVSFFRGYIVRRIFNDIIKKTYHGQKETN